MLRKEHTNMVKQGKEDGAIKDFVMVLYRPVYPQIYNQPICPCSVSQKKCAEGYRAVDEK